MPISVNKHALKLASRRKVALLLITTDFLLPLILGLYFMFIIVELIFGPTASFSAQPKPNLQQKSWASFTMNVNQIVVTNVAICSFDPVTCDVDGMFGRRLKRGWSHFCVGCWNTKQVTKLLFHPYQSKTFIYYLDYFRVLGKVFQGMLQSRSQCLYLRHSRCQH